MKMEFEDLSSQVLKLIIQDLAFERLNQLCLLNPKLNQKICLNEDFWQHKYLRDFGIPQISPLIWKETYRQRHTNRVYTFGLNNFGQLGLGDKQQRLSPERVLLPKRIISISAGRIHSLILTEDGQVYAFGSNNYGQLGLGNQIDRLIPERIPFGLKPKEKIISISAGEYHSLILTKNGKVYAFGRNEHGQLGLGDQQNRLSPERIPFGLKPKEKIVSISTGNYHSLILTENGQVHGFGRNSLGQLGLGDRQSRSVPVRIPFSQKIKAISAGSLHNLILTKDGQVYALGWNFRGQLGLGDKQTRLSPIHIPFKEKIRAISAGSTHNLILTKNGEVYGFGLNNRGQLGLGDQEDRWIPDRIPFGLKPKEKIISISAGGVHSLILTVDGEVYAFGSNSGKLGLGDQKQRLSPEEILHPERIIEISAGRNHSLILAEEYALFSSVQTLFQNDWVKNYELKYRTSENTAVFEFIDIQGQSYLIEVFYDPKTDEIFEF